MKKQVRENFRVEATPDLWGYNKTEDQAKAVCEEIAVSIRRHVDNVDSVAVNWDTRTVCSLCGREWEEDDEGCPCCCNQAIEEWEAGEEVTHEG